MDRQLKNLKGIQLIIELLDNYKGANGRKYKNDYRAILSWVIDKYYTERKKPSGSFNQSNSAENPQAEMARRAIEMLKQQQGECTHE